MRKINIVDEIIVSTDEIHDIPIEIGNDIINYYKKQKIRQVIVLVVLDGSKIFAADIFSERFFGNCKDTKFKINHIKAKTYVGTQSSPDTLVDFCGIELNNYFKNKHLLVIDDIYDTGYTLSTIVRRLKNYAPKSIECCVLLDRDIEHSSKVDVRFIGKKTEIEGFFIGYGLDYNGKYRELPFVSTFNADIDTGEIIEEVICNKCGESCKYSCGMKGDPLVSHGLINGKVMGYFTSPVLQDLTTYKFDICEKCLQKYFDSFKIPVEMSEHSPFHAYSSCKNWSK